MGNSLEMFSSPEEGGLRGAEYPEREIEEPIGPDEIESFLRSRVVPQFEIEEEPSRPPRDFEGCMGEPEDLDQQGIKDYIYHETDLVAHAFNTMKEITTLMEKMEKSMDFAEKATEELSSVYKTAYQFLHFKVPWDEGLQAVVRAMKESDLMQRKRDEKVRTVADNIYSSFQKLEKEVAYMTRPVVGNPRKPIVVEPPA